jgi:hypothetical protein
MARISTLLFCTIASTSEAFTSRSSHRPTTQLPAGRGFGSSNAGRKGKGFGGEKTYGKTATNPIQDVIDTEAAMSEFFSSNEEWHPLFHSFASNQAPAWSFLGSPSEFDFDRTESPWRRLKGIPTDESDRAILANVLDSMQASLIDIPVDETTKDDSHDLHFLEEGRRILAISRFHVLQGVKAGSVECHDRLFSICWSELMELRTRDEVSTGSLIVVPDYDISDLRRFTDINLLRPLEWLGVQGDFEVTSLHRGSPAIRFLHKLQDMPDQPWKGPPEEGPIEIGPN